jgi:hypothetical protein
VEGIKKSPKPFFCGPRKLNIILTQLRSSASFLNFDLFRVGIVSDLSCRCGAALEYLKHFFLDCPIYIQATLIGNSNRVTTCYTLEVKIIFNFRGPQKKGLGTE